MGGWTSGGANIYLGVTRSGKTTLAQKHLVADSVRWKLPRVTLDFESAIDWANVPHAASADEVLDALYVRRVSPRVWTPRDERERAKFFMAVGFWGGACIMWDGMPMIADAHNLDEEARKCLYRWGHGKLGPTFHYIVSQRAALLHRNVGPAVRCVYVFRQIPGVDADRMFKEFGIPQGNPKVPGSGSTAFVRGEHVPILLGFPEGDDASGAGPDPGDCSAKGGRQNPTPPQK